MCKACNQRIYKQSDVIFEICDDVFKNIPALTPDNTWTTLNTLKNRVSSSDDCSAVNISKLGSGSKTIDYKQLIAAAQGECRQM